MRIRQIRPEFFTDPTMAALPPDVRLTYIGLWIVADDAGWLRWDIAQIGAVLYPFESVKRRERHLLRAYEQLRAAGRLVYHDCGCVQVPTLSRHQRVTGKQSFSAKEAHRTHLSLSDKQSPLSDKQSPLSDSPVTVGNGRERYGTVTSAQAREDERTRLGESMAAGGGFAATLVKS